MTFAPRQFRTHGLMLALLVGGPLNPGMWVFTLAYLQQSMLSGRAAFYGYQLMPTLVLAGVACALLCRWQPFAPWRIVTDVLIAWGVVTLLSPFLVALPDIVFGGVETSLGELIEMAIFGWQQGLLPAFSLVLGAPAALAMMGVLWVTSRRA